MMNLLLLLLLLLFYYYYLLMCKLVQILDATNAPYRMVHAFQLMSSEMFSAVYGTHTVTCLVRVSC